MEHQPGLNHHMKLIASLTSPYARKVRIVLAEKKIDCPIEVGLPGDSDNKVFDYNPLGKVPVLELDETSHKKYRTLFDSRVIVEYLDNVSPVQRLLPDSHRQLILVKRWEALADGIVDAAVAIFQEQKRPMEQQSQEWIQRQRNKIDNGLNALSYDLGEQLWCYGDSYSLADIAVGCCLDYLDFRFPDIEWKTSYPNLVTLQQKLATRQSFIDTVPPSV